MGYRVAIPKTLRELMLNEMHLSHMGMVEMKNLSSSYIWWPGTDKEIEEIARTCEACASLQQAPSKAPLQ